MEQQYVCGVCERSLTTKAFSASQLHHHPEQNTTLRCQQCHTCETCKKKVRAEDFPANGKSCHACVRGETHCICGACEIPRPVTDFDANVLFNARIHKRTAVCLECFSRGYSPKDTTKYPCLVCGNLGHTKFAAKDLNNWKTRGCKGKLACSDCKTRKQEIDHKLKLRGAWTCTCPGTGLQRTHLLNNEKCKLFPTTAGEKRWPGKNKGVSAEDFAFWTKVTDA